jgi:hypothetical protein
MEKEEVALGCLAAIPALALSLVLKAWALSILWGWFINPIWHGPTPTKVSFIGISTIWGLVTHDPTRYAKEEQSVWEMYTSIILAPLCSLGFGWLILWITK